jgi:hypothetical protein
LFFEFLGTCGVAKRRNRKFVKIDFINKLRIFLSSGGGNFNGTISDRLRRRPRAQRNIKFVNPRGHWGKLHGILSIIGIPDFQIEKFRGSGARDLEFVAADGVVDAVGVSGLDEEGAGLADGDHPGGDLDCFGLFGVGGWRE